MRRGGLMMPVSFEADARERFTGAFRAATAVFFAAGAAFFAPDVVAVFAVTFVLVVFFVVSVMVSVYLPAIGRRVRDLR